MFTSIDYDLEFASTGRRFKQKLAFARGMTAITGANESGKSLVLEMLRFALFGAAALRGKASDFKSLKLSCTFVVRDVEYTVTRTKSNAQLLRGEEAIAVGTSPVNEKIVQILGFGLVVFDVACAANQGDMEQLSKMGATERRRMVDGVIGIGALEILGKWAAEEARLRETEARAVISVLKKPEQPVRPAGYSPSINLRQCIEIAKHNVNELRRAEALLQVQRTKPVAPSCSVSIPAENIEPLAEAQQQRRAQMAQLKAGIDATANVGTLVPVEEIDRLEAQWKRFEAYSKAQAELARSPLPAHSRAELESMRDAHSALAALGNITSRIELKSAELERAKQHAMECPACSHHWFLDPARVAALADEVAQLVATRSGMLAGEPATPTLSTSQVAAELKAWDRIDLNRIAQLRAVPAEENPGVDSVAITRLRKAHELAQQNAEFKDAYNALKAQETEADFVAMLATRRAYEAALETYQKQALEYAEWEKAREEARVKAAELAKWPAELAEVEGALEDAMLYEHELKHFDRLSKEFEDGMARAAELNVEAEQYRKVQSAFSRLRTKVKQHLLPSLNAVASKLLRDMTGGSRNVIVVDDDFEISVDGQHINTLSGSGKVCANLALRLALGQVLTANVFSAFLGDEVDASMDEFRAENTALTLRMLQKRVSQLIVISHKSLEADHFHRLGETTA